MSDKFEGVKPLIKRHRLVTAAITADTDGKLDFHSLSVAAAKTPAEWDGVVAPSPKCAGGDGRGTRGTRRRRANLGLFYPAAYK